MMVVYVYIGTQHIYYIDYNTILYDLYFFFAQQQAHTAPRTAQTSGNVVQSEWVNRIMYNI